MRRAVHLCVLGTLAALGCHRSARSEPPVLRLSARAPGFGVDEVETQVALPLERALLELGSVRSVSFTGLARVEVQPRLDPDAARAAILERLRGVQLPPGVVPVLAPGVSPGASVRFTLQGDQTLGALRDQLRGELERLPGVAEVWTCAPGDDAVRVTVDGMRAAALGVSLQDVVRVLSGPSADLNALGELRLRETPAPIPLREVATLERGPAVDTCRAQRDGLTVAEAVAQLGPKADRAELERALAAKGSHIRPWPATSAATAIHLTLGYSTESSGPRLLDTATRVARALKEKAHADSVLVETHLAADDVSGFPSQLDVYASGTTGEEALRALRQEAPYRFARVDGASARVRVRGPDVAALDSLVRKAEDALGPGAGAASNSLPTLRAEPDRMAAAEHGVAIGDVAAATAASLDEGLWVSESVRLRWGGPGSPSERIAAVQLVTPHGAVPLSAVARFQMSVEPAFLLREDGRRYEDIFLDGGPAALEDARQRLPRLLQLPPGYSLEFLPH